MLLPLVVFSLDLAFWNMSSLVPKAVGLAFTLFVLSLIILFTKFSLRLRISCYKMLLVDASPGWMILLWLVLLVPFWEAL